MSKLQQLRTKLSELEKLYSEAVNRYEQGKKDFLLKKLSKEEVMKIYNLIIDINNQIISTKKLIETEKQLQQLEALPKPKTNLDNIIIHLEKTQALIRGKALDNYLKTCNKDLQYYTGSSTIRATTEMKDILKLLCSRGSNYFFTDIIKPLYTWLYTYNKWKKGEQARTGNTDQFYRSGINHLYRYIIVLDYFRQNPGLFTKGDISIGTEKGKQDFKQQMETEKEFLTVINDQFNELIGCSQDFTTDLLNIVKNIENKNILKPIQYKIDYLDDICFTLKYKKI